MIKDAGPNDGTPSLWRYGNVKIGKPRASTFFDVIQVQKDRLNMVLNPGYKVSERPTQRQARPQVRTHQYSGSLCPSRMMRNVVVVRFVRLACRIA